MILGVFLAIGESIAEFQAKGQYDLLFEQKLSPYVHSFEHVYIFSYANERLHLHERITVIPNLLSLHRYVYALVLPFLHLKYIKQCSLLRGLQLSGAIPAAISKIFFSKPYVFNYGYQYYKMAIYEAKFIQAIGFRLLESLLIYHANSIICLTPSLKRYVKRIYKKAHVYLIPNSVNTSLFSPRHIKKKYDVLFIGRLEATKNLESLLFAVAHLKKGITLALIGSGTMKGKLDKLAKDIGVSLSIINPLPHRHLPFHLAACRCFVLPSLIEGHSKALLEAMSCGLPVVASDIPSNREVIRHKETGLLCKPTREGIAYAIERVLENKAEAKRLGINARKYIVKHYDQKHWQKSEIEVLKSLNYNYGHKIN